MRTLFALCLTLTLLPTAAHAQPEPPDELKKKLKKKKKVKVNTPSKRQVRKAKRKAANARAAIERSLVMGRVAPPRRTMRAKDVVKLLKRKLKVPIQTTQAAASRLNKKVKKLKKKTSGMTLLDVLTKATKLDYTVTKDGVVIDTPSGAKKLRKKEGLPLLPARTEEEVTKLLKAKRLKVKKKDRELFEVLLELSTKSGVRIIPLPGAAPKLGSSVSRPLGRLLTKLLEPHDWGWKQVGAVVLVGPERELAKQSGGDDGEANDDDDDDETPKPGKKPPFPSGPPGPPR